MNWKRIKITGLLAVAALIVVGMVSEELYKSFSADRPIAYVRKYKPDVNIFPKDIQAEQSEPLYSGDTLVTNVNGYAAVQFMDKSIARVKPSSQLIVHGEVTGKDDASTRINLEVGEIFMNVTKRTTTNFEVATSTTVASVKGTQFGANDSNYFWVVEGIVDLLVNNTGNTSTLTDRMFGQVNDDGTISTGDLTDDELNELNEEFNQLEEDLEPRILKLRFRDQNGQLREIEIKYFEN